MDKRKLLIVLLIVVILFTITVGFSAAQEADEAGITAPENGPPFTESFSYQGSLTMNGNPADGIYDFNISIWNAETGGIQISSCQVLDDQMVENGLFSINCVPVDLMGDVFNGEARWIQVEVKPDSGGAYTTLPRQPISASPYAWSLRPGAVISDTLSSVGEGVLNITAKTGPAAEFGGALGKNLLFINAGVYGYANHENGIGVVGSDTNVSGVSAGVSGSSSSTSGRGVTGSSTATSGTAYGVYGSAVSADGYGGYFINTDTHTGIGYVGTSLFAEKSTGDGRAIEGDFAGNSGVAIYGNNLGASGTGTYGRSSTGIGVYGYTLQSEGNYGLYTPQNLYSNNIHMLGAERLIVQNGGLEALELGDIVVFAGIKPPLEEDGSPVIQVAKASVANDTAVAGVVFSGYNITTTRLEPEDMGSQPFLLEGSIEPGGYLLMVVRGPAQVKAAALSSPIRAGDLLSTSDLAGYAARTKQVYVDGIEVATPGTVFGKALQELESGDSLIYVFVTLH